MHDLKFTLRQLWKHKASSLLAILILALGMGANTLVWFQESANEVSPCTEAQGDSEQALIKACLIALPSPLR